MLFLSEVAEVRIRTILLIVHNITFEIGAALVYYMGNQMPWRDATLFYAMVPIMAILSLSIVSFLFDSNPFRDEINIQFNYFRYPIVHIGFCHTIDRLMLSNHYNGFAVGLNRMSFESNSKIYNDTRPWHTFVMNVKNEARNVIIRNRIF